MESASFTTGERSAVPPVDGSGPGDKGLKANAIGFVSNVVIGVASTAPGYSLAASLGFVVAITGIGLAAPAILLMAFLPMLFIASAYYYMNRADPDCGTTFSWVSRAMGPWAGWMGGWAIVVADIIVMANLAQIAGLYSFLLVGWDSAAESTAAVTFIGVIWIAVMTAICVIGIELSARTQGLPARRRAHHARPVRDRRARQGRRRRRRPERRRSEPLVDQPVRGRQLRRIRRGHPDRDLHLLGLGLDGHGQRGERGLERDPGQGGDRGDGHPARHLRPRRRRRAGLQRPAGADRQRRRRAQRVGHRRVRLAAGQDPDHRGAHVGGRLDADDDPAHGAHVAVDGPSRGDAAVARRGPPALPDAPRLDDPHGRVLDRLVRRPDDHQREHPLRLDRRAGPDDRLLLRADRLRVRDLLPQDDLPQRQDVLPRRRAAAARRPDPHRRLRQVDRRSLRPGDSESGDSWFGVGPPLIIGVGFLLMGAVLMLIWYASGHREFFRRRPETAPRELIESAPAMREG